MANDLALNPDDFGIQLLVNKNSTESRARACKELTNMAITCFIPDYLRVSRACFLSKKNLLCFVLWRKTHIDCATPNKIPKTNDLDYADRAQLCYRAQWQLLNWFHKFQSTQELIAYVMTRVKYWKIFIFVNFAKTFDKINRKKLCTLLRQVAKNEGLVTKHCVELIINLLEG